MGRGTRASGPEERVASTEERPRRHTRRHCLERLALAWAPVTVELEREAGRVTLRDREQTVVYELSFRAGTGRAGGPGWLERELAPTGERASFAVTAAEVMALLRDTGREAEAAAMTCALAAFFEREPDPACQRIAGRLRAEVAAGERRERVALNAIQGRIVGRLVAGESLSELCERGGFLQAGGNPDTSWLQRRAGLLPERCSKTGKRRLARTATYPVFCQLVRAVGADPHEFGV
jgi:hypothetical protein